MTFKSKLATIKRHWKLSAAALGFAIAAGFGAQRYVASEDVGDFFQLRAAPPATDDGLALALFQSLGVRLLPGHTLRYVPNGSVFDVAVSEVAKAQSSVHVLMYIWEKGAASDRVASALIARAQAGVRCRILVDDVGSPDFAKTVAPGLIGAGCEVRVFRPLAGAEKLARNHRKLLVVDGVAAITGGFGVRDTWLGDGVHAESWRDSNILFTGPAVTDAQQAFAENWQEAGGALLPGDAFVTPPATGPSRAAFVGSTQGVLTRAERLTQLLIASARHRLWIANAYFVPSKGILALLTSKARAGVDVRILAPYKNSDSKTAFGAQHMEYGDLLKQGVRVWEYTSSMMHAKTMVIDENITLIGSINLDPLSLNELEEDGLVTQDPAFTAELARAFEADCGRSRELTK